MNPKLSGIVDPPPRYTATAPSSSSISSILSPELKSMFFSLVMAKILLDLPQICLLFATSSKFIYLPTIVHIIVDIFLLCSVYDTHLRDLKYIEVFSHICMFYYIFATILLPVSVFFLRVEVISRFGPVNSFFLTCGPFAVWHINLRPFIMDHTFMWYVEFIGTILINFVSLIIAALFVQTTKWLAEDMIIKKRIAEQRRGIQSV